MSSSSIINRFKSNGPPRLPQEAFNPLLANYKGKIRSVRTQDINLATDSTITIARVKIPAPDKISTHLIKRFDTDAISATSFFKSAFPLATDQDESIQMDYLHKIYDTHNAGALDLGPDRRLTGVWVPIQHASELADAYGLSRFAQALIDFPNPNLNSTQATDRSSPKPQPVIDSDHPQTPKASSNVDRKLNPSSIHPKPIDQQAPLTRSSKRSRLAPPCFGNTSPSTFNLSSLNKPPSQVHQPDRPAGSGDSPSTDRHLHLHHHHQKDTQSLPDDLTSPTTTEINPTLTPAKTNVESRGGRSSPPSRLVGTDEQVRKAQQDALELVSNIRSSSLESRPKSITAPIERHQPTPAKDDHRDLGGPDELTNRKRSVDEISEPGSDRERQLRGSEEEEGVGPNDQHRSTTESFLPKLLWRRSGEANRRREEILRMKKHRTESHPRSHVPLAISGSTHPVDSTLSPAKITKRNLAIAGIVIAGAAASIAPYFF